jgi:hypothetical protein
MSNPNPRFSIEDAPDWGLLHTPVDPADANLCDEWIEVLDKVGFTPVLVKADYSPELWQNAGFEERLGAELTDAKLGSYDSAKYGNPIKFFFLVASSRLPAGLQFISTRLAAIGLLPHVIIGYADKDSKTWRQVVFPQEWGAAA